MRAKLEPMRPSFQPARALDHAAGDRRVAHEEQGCFFHFPGQRFLGRILRKQNELVSRRAQRRIDPRQLELAVGPDYLGHGASSEACAGTFLPETSIS